MSSTQFATHCSDFMRRRPSHSKQRAGRCKIELPLIQSSMETNTYAKLVNQLAELDKEIERVRRVERSGVIAEIRAQMREYGIKPSELVGRKRGRSPAPPRY